MVPLPEPPKSLTMEMAAAQRAAPNQCRRYRSDLAHRPSFDAVADGAQEDRDAAAAAEREEKRRLELQRQQDEQQAQEQELQQLQVAPRCHPWPPSCITRVRRSSMRCRPSWTRRRETPTTVRAAPRKFALPRVFFMVALCCSAGVAAAAGAPAAGGGIAHPAACG